MSGGEHDDNDENGDEAYVDEEEERKQIMIQVIQKLDPQSKDKSVRKSESFGVQYTVTPRHMYVASLKINLNLS